MEYRIPQAITISDEDIVKVMKGSEGWRNMGFWKKVRLILSA